MFKAEIDESSEEIRKRFKDYCEWCWHHGYGDCDVCKSLMNKRLKELDGRKG